MCGIAGFADGTSGFFSGAAPRNEAHFGLVHRMCEVIRHRGPDDEGIHVEPGVGLGMRRLSIIDLVDRAPADSQRGSNGLAGLQRRDLQLPRAARASSSRPATASIPPATPRPSSTPTRSGARPAFARLRGMFGIALWDRRRGTLLLARDRSGIKPLYYAERGGRLYFGSEIKSLLARRGGRSRDRSGALDHYLAVPVHARATGRSSGASASCRRGTCCAWQNGRLRRRAGTGRSPPTESVPRDPTQEAAEALRGGAGRRGARRT